MAKIVKNSIYNILTWLIPIIFTFIVVPIANDTLGTDVYGIYFILTTIIGFISVLNFGTSDVLITRLSGLDFKKDQSKINELLNSSLLINVVTGTIFMIITALGGNAFLKFFIKGSAANDNLYSLLLLLALSSAFAFVANNYNSFFKAFQMYKIPSISMIVTTVSQNILTIITLLLGYGLMGIAVSIFITGILQMIISIILVKYYYKNYVISLSVDKDVLKDMINFSKYSFLVGILNIILLSSDKLFIGYFFNESEVTYYSVPSNLSIKIQQFTGVALHVIYPYVALYYSKKDMKGLKTLFNRTFKYVTLFVVAASIPAILFSRELLVYWMNEEFAAKSTAILQISILAYLLLAFSAIPYYFFYGMNEPKKNFVFSMLSGGLTMVFNILLIPKLSGLGAAITTLISCSACFIALNSSRNLLGIKFSEFISGVLKPVLVLGVIELIIGLILKKLIVNFVLVFILGAVCLGAFVVLYFVLKFNDDFEKEKLNNILNKFKRR